MYQRFNLNQKSKDHFKSGVFFQLITTWIILLRCGIINLRSHPGSQSIHTSFSSSNNIITEKKRILIVDDEMDIANLYKLSLERDGFFVDILNDPLLALSILTNINSSSQIHVLFLLQHLCSCTKLCYAV